MERKTTRWLGLFFGFLIVAAMLVAVGCANLSEKSDALIAAHRAGRPIPVLSVDDPGIDSKTAYEIQKLYVAERLKSDGIGGFKGGLTSKATMEKFGVDSAVTGVLFESGRHEGHSVIKAASFRMPMIETEIGYVVGERIDSPVRNFAELTPRIKGVVPAIELPDLGFADMKQLKGVDIIAANVASAQYIVGMEHALVPDTLDDISVSLRKDGETLSDGKGSDALGGQGKAVVWLVNSIVAQGYSIEPGQVLITGALGKLVPGKKGVYIADFGEALGKLFFNIE